MATLGVMAEAWVHLNGRLVPAAGAAVSVRDSGLLHGASTFTTMLAHQRVVFRLDRHVSRLLETTALMGIRTGATAESLSAATKELLEANALPAARVRITLTPGSVSGGEPTTLITADPPGACPGERAPRGE